MEDRDTGHHQHSDGGTDRHGNDVMHEHVHVLVKSEKVGLTVRLARFFFRNIVTYK